MSLNQRVKAVLAELDGQPVAHPSVEGSAVFLLEAGRRRWVQSPASLARLGFDPADVRQLEAQVLLEIPLGEPIGGGLSAELRYALTSRYLVGRGVELGGAASPQRVPIGSSIEPFDLRGAEELARHFETAPGPFEPTRSVDELPERFPGGADFLVAHHVLQRACDPIGALVRWHGWVRDSGVMVVSVPHVDHCPDRGRHVPPLEHLLMDHLLERGDDAFESREHVYSFVMGWCDDGFGKGLDKHELSRKAHECANRTGNALHWHAFRPQLLEQVIDAAATFSGCRAAVQVLAGPAPLGEAPATDGEILCAYRLERLPAHVAAPSPLTLGALRSAEAKLWSALSRLQRATTSGKAPV